MLNTELRDVFEFFHLKAKRFCALIEESPHLSREELLAKLEVELADLYETALRMPDADPETDTEAEPELKPIYSALEEKLGDANSYWVVFDPRQNEEPVRGSLTEDVHEIYRELSTVLTMADKGASVSELVWHARLMFNAHWGLHAVGALRALYFLLHG